jgi:hypothetical protein
MLFVRSVAAALVAGALAGLAGGPEEAQAINFPVQIDFSYCWGYATPCPFPPSGAAGSASWLLQQNKTYQDNFGNAGTWTVDVATQRIELTYTQYGTVYQGQHMGGGCFQGVMSYGSYTGTWAGCK